MAADDRRRDASRVPLINEPVRREIRGVFREQYQLLESLMHGPAQLTFMEALDHSQTQELQFKHALRVAEIAERSGWPGPDLIGAEATGCLMLVLEHARQFPEVEQRILNVMEPAFFRGEVLPDVYATYVDDAMLRRGGGQVYSTSIVRSADGSYSSQALSAGSTLSPGYPCPLKPRGSTGRVPGSRAWRV